MTDATEQYYHPYLGMERFGKVLEHVISVHGFGCLMGEIIDVVVWLRDQAQDAEKRRWQKHYLYLMPHDNYRLCRAFVAATD